MRKKITYVLLGIILVASIATRYIGLTRQHDLTFDEILYGRLGYQLKEDPFNYTSRSTYDEYIKQGHRLPDYLKRPLFKHPPLYSYLISLVFRFTRPTYGAAGLVSIVSGTLMILAAFILGKLLYNDRVGLLAALFLLLDPIHWLCSEKIWLEATMSLFMWLAFLLFVLALRRAPKLYIVSGIACGLAVLTKYPGLLVVPAILTYAFICQPRLYKRTSFWAMIITPFIMMIPWTIWNIKVYGLSAFDIRHMHHGSIEILDFMGRFTKGGWPAVLVAGAVLLAVMLYLRISGKDKRILGAFGDARVQKYARPLALILGCLASAAIFLHPYVLQRLTQSFSFQHIPRAGWIMGMFAKEPKVFYLAQMMEHSPIYIISFLSIALLITSGKKGDLFLLSSALWIFAFYILWGNYQCRYILSAVPALLIIAARTIVWSWDILRRSRSPILSKLTRVLLLVMVGLFILKTLKVDLALALTNWPCYF